MKKFIGTGILLMAGIVFAQNPPPVKSPYGTLNISTGVVAPGCEYLDAKKIKELDDCFRQFLLVRLVAELDYYAERMDEMNSDKVKTKIQFIVNQEGKLADIRLSEGEFKSDFSDAVIKALENISKKVSFKPAAYADGTPSDSSISLPVTMIYESD